ncbi:Hypothetical predicted protein [Octopus vulgaris]|uniref:Uncharacterized protein n=1 Tax=Octopus vulgaris TaxID=6645 RepID=A0AA36BC93_OCTVU|nr:Hypothetical predicted protein [Octopus vulgaris]
MESLGVREMQQIFKFNDGGVEGCDGGDGGCGDSSGVNGSGGGVGDGDGDGCGVGETPSFESLKLSNSKMQRK